MTDTAQPSEAAIREACRRARIAFREDVNYDTCVILAAQLIEKYEPETLVDPVVLRAREICREAAGCLFTEGADKAPIMLATIRALREGMPS